MPMTMLSNMYDDILAAHECSPEEAYDILISWIAVKTSLEVQLSTPGIKASIYDALHRTFDLELLRSQKYDWFGDLLVAKGIIPGIATHEESELKTSMVLAGGDFTKSMPHTILIQNTWTGRDILAAHKLTGEGAIYFGLEANKMLYRTAVLNMHIHQIPAQILNADPLVIDTNIASENWRQSNLWNPIKPEKLKQA